MAKNRWIIGNITPIGGVTTLLITGRPRLCRIVFDDFGLDVLVTYI